jgi:uncharacterized protein YhbP (UPF0306 family)
MAKIMREFAEAHGIDIQKELEKLSAEEVEPEKIVYKLKVETHDNTLYLFDKDSDEFICQGSSVQELAKLALERKQIALAAVLHDTKVFAFRNGESSEVTA